MMTSGLPTFRLPALLLAVWICGCAGRVPPVPDDFPYRDGDARARAESLCATVQAVADGGWNPGRYRAALRRAGELGLGERTRSEWIDWFSFQRNVVIEVGGPGPEIVYVVAHLDKTDINPLKVASVFVNGLLDEAVSWSFFSSGAVDNATGVAVALELASALRDAPLRKRYRILLTGSEESGLRGSRAHAARLPSTEWDELAMAINIDSVGAESGPNAVLTNVSDVMLAGRLTEAARRLSIPLKQGLMPPSGSSDYEPFARTGMFRDFFRGISFNLPGGFLPQRSWFTASHSAPVLALSADPLIDGWDYVAGLLWLPVGRIHGPRDDPKRVHPTRLYEAFAILREFILELERPPEALRPST